MRTSCTSCGGLIGLASGQGCGCGSQCIPGRKPPCFPCDSCHCLGRFFNGIYECLCYPDPFYEGAWLPIADSAFFTDAPRPITQMRLRWDSGWNFRFPDRAEYFWAAERSRSKAPAPVVVPDPHNPRVAAPKGPKAVNDIDYRQFSLYTEVALNRFGIFFEVPYRRVESEPTLVDFSGFADLITGTKSLLVDCPLAQLALQFKVFIPSGQPSKGLGTGHVSLEPSLLLGLRLAPETYLQTQFAYWIPIGGDQVYAGDVFHYHLSLNQTLWRPTGGLQLVGVIEGNGWAVLDGAYTQILDNGTLQTNRARGHIFSAGPGLRLFICDRYDLGVGSSFAFGSTRWAQSLVRAELRWRF
jgi:hypothetical protein